MVKNQRDFAGVCQFDFVIICLARTDVSISLRKSALRSTEKRKVVVGQTQAQLVGYLRGGSFNSRRLADIVNYIRQNAEFFSEWPQSETAKLFAPPVFRNDKNAAREFVTLNYCSQ